MNTIKKERNRARNDSDWMALRQASKRFRKRFREKKLEHRKRLIQEISEAPNPWEKLYRLQPGLRRRKTQDKGNPNDTPDDIAQVFAQISNEDGITSKETQDEYKALLDHLQQSPDWWRFPPIQPCEV